MTYFLSPALATLHAQINARWPNRDKASDGWIGDAAHNARKSDHNPDYTDGGIVRAIDVDKDGVDMDMLVNVLLNDPRTWYVIWNKRISYGKHVDGVPMGWRPYTGTNTHERHMHVSVRKVGNHDRNDSLWKFPGVSTPAKPTTPSKGTTVIKDTINGEEHEISEELAIDRILALSRRNEALLRRVLENQEKAA